MESEAFQIPPIPQKFDKIYKSKHYSEPDKVYSVNLYKLTCECSDYQRREKLYSGNDIRKICKHIIDKLKYTKIYQGYDNFLAYLIHCSAYFNDDLYYRAMIKDEQIVFSYHIGSEWVNVHTAPKRTGTGNVFGFAYNLKDQFWSYQGEPKNHKEIAKFILNHFDSL